jgi:hypothetical protein
MIQNTLSKQLVFDFYAFQKSKIFPSPTLQIIKIHDISHSINLLTRQSTLRRRLTSYGT